MTTTQLERSPVDGGLIEVQRSEGVEESVRRGLGLAAVEQPYVNPLVRDGHSAENGRIPRDNPALARLGGVVLARAS